MTTMIITAAALVLALLVACGAASPGPPRPADGPGDPKIGQQLFFKTQEMTGAPTCSTCHTLETEEPAIVGPNLSGVALRARVRVPGQSAEAYLRESMLDPSAHVVEGYQQGIMVRNYADYLTPQQINDLVAFLLTLE
ncbi:MAG: cytochrome c [Chloroflexaceae bacterium]|nr:cytochrome c [Chloroflexaceae bacterium]